MGDKSGIEWTNATWNPVTGCTKISPGCKFCYAERGFPRVYPGRDFSEIRIHTNRLQQPLQWKKPRLIFVNSMSDLFHGSLPWSFIMEIFSIMAKCPQHTFQILTKRADNMLRFCEFLRESTGEGPLSRDFPWPLPNVWLGISAENQEMLEKRAPFLLKTGAAKLFLSYEPALGPLEARSYLADPLDAGVHLPWEGRDLPPIDWVIAGGESGPHARPAHPDWFKSLREQCVQTRTPFFFKQWGEWFPVSQTSEEMRRWAVRHPQRVQLGKDDEIFVRIGKKTSGRLLDGKEWSQMPEVSP